LGGGRGNGEIGERKVYAMPRDEKGKKYPSLMFE